MEEKVVNAKHLAKKGREERPHANKSIKILMDKKNIKKAKGTTSFLPGGAKMRRGRRAKA